jgi:hypothetical protein
MNTKIIIGIVAVVAVAGAGYAFTRTSPAGMPAQTQEQTQETSAAAQSGQFTGSIADLSARGGDWKCTVDAQAATGGGAAASSGVVYVSGKKVRGDFTSTVQGIGPVEAHLVADGTNVYSWSSLLPQGIKTTMAASEPEESAATSGGGADANQRYTYDCQPAHADASLFVAPADISFRTL